MQFRDIFGHLFWNLGGELWAYTLVALGYQWLPQQAHSGFFHIRTEMPILAFSSLLREKKKNSSDKMLASDSSFYTKLLFMHHLIFGLRWI